MIKREDIKIGYRIYRNNVSRRDSMIDPTVGYYATIISIVPVEVAYAMLPNTCDIGFTVDWDMTPSVISAQERWEWAVNRTFFTLSFWDPAP